MANKGLIIGLVIGITSLIVGTIIGLVIVQQLISVDNSIETTLTTRFVTNESGYINSTGYTLSRSTATGFANPSITGAFNTTSSQPIPNIAGNITVSGTGVVTNASIDSWDDALVSYSYQFKAGTTAAEDLRSNFTKGIGNVSTKIPTVLLIAAVVLLLSILLILWGLYQRMGISNSSGGL